MTAFAATYDYVRSQDVVATPKRLLRMAEIPLDREEATGVSALTERLQTLADDCAFPDWDGYGAQPVSQSAVQMAVCFIEQLTTLRSLVSPEISPAPDGTILVDWVKGDTRFVVQVCGDGFLAYAQVSPSSRIKGRERLGKRLPDHIGVILRDFRR